MKKYIIVLILSFFLTTTAFAATYSIQEQRNWKGCLKLGAEVHCYTYVAGENWSYTLSKGTAASTLTGLYSSKDYQVRIIILMLMLIDDMNSQIIKL